jgi:DNA-directed RNA polymerase specialized sigma24 family protein
MNHATLQRVPDAMDWPEIVQQHGPIVWKTVYRLLSNEADAADCFQNAFMAALDVSRTQTVRNWPGLLKRLATTSALERLRQRYRQSGRETGLPRNPLADPRATEPAC